MRHIAPLVVALACTGTLSALPEDKSPVADDDRETDTDTDTDTDADTGAETDTDTDTDTDSDTDTDTDTDFTGDTGPGFEVCDDGVDNDGDGRRDCADVDCATDPACLPPCPDLVYGAAPLAGDTSGNGDDLTPSCGSAGPAPDVYVEFTAPSAGIWVFDTAGTGFDTVLTAFDQCGGAELACNQDSVGDTSLIAVGLVAGESIVLSVDGYRATQAGPFTLTASLAPAAELACDDGADDDFDGVQDCADPDCVGEPVCITCPDGVFVTSPFAGSTSGASDDETPTCAGTPGAPDASVVFTASAAGRWSFTTDGSAFDTVLTARSSCGGAVLDCDDDGGNIGAGSLVTLDLTAGQTVVLVIDGYGMASSGAYTLAAYRTELVCDDGIDEDGDGFEDCVDPDCAAAAACACYEGVLGAAPYLGDTSGVTDSVVPTCSLGIGGRDHIVRYTAPTAGTWTFGTDASAFDTVVSVLDGCGGAVLACDDDGGLGLTSRASALLAAGQTVAVVVDGYSNAAYGAFELTATRTEGSCNDRVDGDGDGFLDCFDPDCDAVAECAVCRYDGNLTVPGTRVESTTDAVDGFDPSCATPVGGRDHAYAFTAPTTASYTFDTIGSSFDTVLYVLDNCPTATTELGCHDDIQFAVVQQSELTVALTAGQTVFVVVDGYDSLDFGDYVLNVR